MRMHFLKFVLALAVPGVAISANIQQANAQSIGELYDKYVLQACVNAFKGKFPPGWRLAEHPCKHWFTFARNLPLLEKELSGAYNIPIRIIPCPGDPRCPDPAPWRAQFEQQFGDIKPIPDLLAKAGLDEKFPGFAKEINAQRIEQTKQFRDSLAGLVAELDKHIDAFDAVGTQFEK